MRRIIPKQSKVGIKVFKSFTLIDLLVACVLLAIGILLIFSNFNYKFPVLVVYVVLIITLFLGDEEDRTYKQLAYWGKFVVSKKSFVKGKKHSDTNELIPFKKIRENGVIEYDGYLGAIVEVGSIDFGLIDEDEQDRRISVFARVLNSLSQSSVIQIVKLDRPIKYDEVGKTLFEKINDAAAEDDAAKRAILQTRLNQIDDVNNLMPLFRPCYYIVIYEEGEKTLFNQIDVCMSGLDNAGLSSEFLDARAVAVFFKYCYTRNFNERDVGDVALEDLTEYVKPDKIKFNLGGYTVDDTYTFTFAIKDYPLYVGNAWGDALFNINDTKVVLTIKPIDKDKAIKRIDTAVVESASRNAGKLSEARNQQTHIQTMNELQEHIQNENEFLFDCTATVTGINNTEKDNKTFRKEIRRELTTNGFRISYLLSRQFEGFAKSTIARRSKLRAYERGINSESLAAIFPFVFSTIIDRNGYNFGRDYYPVILDIWKRDNEHINSNGFIIGKSGSGKSFFMKLLISLVYSDSSRIFILDPENEYQVLAKNLGGIFIDVGNATQGRINPLHIYPVLTDEGELASPEVIYNSHLQFLEDFFKITLKGITQDAFEELNNIIRLTYSGVGIEYDTDCSEFTPDRFPTFDLLKQTVEKELSRSDLSPLRKNNLERVNTYIAKFATGGMYSSLWNGASTLEVDSRIVVFNFQSLFGSKNKTVANAQILVVMRYLEMQIINIREMNRNSDLVIHPLVVVDEGYFFVDPDYPVALNFIYQESKRIRKYEGGVIFGTQNMSDMFGNPAVVAKTSAIVNNSQYSFVFNLAPADLEILTDLYKNVGGLNPAEQAYISDAGRGDCFAICSPRQRARFHVEAPDMIRSLFENSDFNL